VRVDRWPNQATERIFRLVFIANIPFIIFFFYAAEAHELQYVIRGLNLYSGLVLLVFSLLSFLADWRYALVGLLVSLVSIFLGTMPVLAY
jgi:hypothetical protein